MTVQIRLLSFFLLLPLNAAIRRILADGNDKQTCSQIHFIHVGKTGGTTVLNWLRQAYPEVNTKQRHQKDFHNFVFHGHGFTLGNGKPEDCYTFLVRDPVERWVSGFLSRLRKGCPAFCSKWTAQEELIFKEFPTPNDLAEALASNDTLMRERALWAHKGITHTRNGFEHYLPDLDQLMSRIVFVGHTSQLNSDFENMLRAGNMPEWQKIDYTAKHQNPPELEHLKELSPKGHAAVKELLAPDFQIMDKLSQAGLITREHLAKTQCNEGQPVCMIRNELYGTYHTVKADAADVHDMSIEDYHRFLESTNVTFFETEEDAMANA
eukprot:gnl/MRDRNA2_/MRDRNA2_131024_c0_seq1.p1 gnl/MRDRNA2_/MRDRNA2_131024_c0~~gnl/MRDRNA2_/MRDRNA2_131024_c0_seq1.p1  ORF type:complete len:346 (+),score=40.29 gnl/MRDRNA2_/MRDRNA2_131024_c0_seq1:72-1040(+)